MDDREQGYKRSVGHHRQHYDTFGGMPARDSGHGAPRDAWESTRRLSDRGFGGSSGGRPGGFNGSFGLPSPDRERRTFPPEGRPLSPGHDRRPYSPDRAGDRDRASRYVVQERIANYRSREESYRRDPVSHRSDDSRLPGASWDLTSDHYHSSSQSVREPPLSRAAGDAPRSTSRESTPLDNWSFDRSSKHVLASATPHQIHIHTSCRGSFRAVDHAPAASGAQRRGSVADLEESAAAKDLEAGELNTGAVAISAPPHQAPRDDGCPAEHHGLSTGGAASLQVPARFEHIERSPTSRGQGAPSSPSHLSLMPQGFHAQRSSAKRSGHLHSTSSLIPARGFEGFVGADTKSNDLPEDSMPSVPTKPLNRALLQPIPASMVDVNQPSEREVHLHAGQSVLGTESVHGLDKDQMPGRSLRAIEAVLPDAIDAAPCCIDRPSSVFSPSSPAVEDQPRTASCADDRPACSSEPDACIDADAPVMAQADTGPEPMNKVSGAAVEPPYAADFGGSWSSATDPLCGGEPISRSDIPFGLRVSVSGAPAATDDPSMERRSSLGVRRFGFGRSRRHVSTKSSEASMEDPDLAGVATIKAELTPRVIGPLKVLGPGQHGDAFGSAVEGDRIGVLLSVEASATGATASRLQDTDELVASTGGADGLATGAQKPSDLSVVHGSFRTSCTEAGASTVTAKLCSPGWNNTSFPYVSGLDNTRNFAYVGYQQVVPFTSYSWEQQPFSADGVLRQDYSPAGPDSLTISASIEQLELEVTELERQLSALSVDLHHSNAELSDVESGLRIICEKLLEDSTGPFEDEPEVQVADGVCEVNPIWDDGDHKHMSASASATGPVPSSSAVAMDHDKFEKILEAFNSDDSQSQPMEHRVGTSALVWRSLRLAEACGQCQDDAKTLVHGPPAGSASDSDDTLPERPGRPSPSRLLHLPAVLFKQSMLVILQRSHALARDEMFRLLPHDLASHIHAVLCTSIREQAAVLAAMPAHLGGRVAMVAPLTAAQPEPNYGQPQDLSAYQANDLRHEAVKGAVLRFLRSRRTLVAAKQAMLVTQYGKHMNTYKQYLTSGHHATFPAFIEAPGRGPMAPASAQYVLGSATRTAGFMYSYSYSDVIRSDLDEQRLLNNFIAVEQLKTMCALPDMLLDNWERRWRSYDNRAGLVSDAMRELEEERMVKAWTGRERVLFMDKFLQHPKDFRKIASYLPGRSPGDCVAFFYKNQKLDEFSTVRRKQQLKKRRLQADMRKQQYAPLLMAPMLARQRSMGPSVAGGAGDAALRGNAQTRSRGGGRGGVSSRGRGGSVLDADTTLSMSAAGASSVLPHVTWQASGLASNLPSFHSLTTAAAAHRTVTEPREAMLAPVLPPIGSSLSGGRLGQFSVYAGLDNVACNQAGNASGPIYAASAHAIDDGPSASAGMACGVNDIRGISAQRLASSTGVGVTGQRSAPIRFNSTGVLRMDGQSSSDARQDFACTGQVASSAGGNELDMYNLDLLTALRYQVGHSANRMLVNKSLAASNGRGGDGAHGLPLPHHQHMYDPNDDVEPNGSAVQPKNSQLVVGTSNISSEPVPAQRGTRSTADDMYYGGGSGSTATAADYVQIEDAGACSIGATRVIKAKRGNDEETLQATNLEITETELKQESSVDAYSLSSAQYRQLQQLQAGLSSLVRGHQRHQLAEKLDVLNVDAGVVNALLSQAGLRGVLGGDLEAVSLNWTVSGIGGHTDDHGSQANPALHDEQLQLQAAACGGRPRYLRSAGDTLQGSGLIEALLTQKQQERAEQSRLTLDLTAPRQSGVAHTASDRMAADNVLNDGAGASKHGAHNTGDPVKTAATSSVMGHEGRNVDVEGLAGLDDVGPPLKRQKHDAARDMEMHGLDLTSPSSMAATAAWETVTAGEVLGDEATAQQLMLLHQNQGAFAVAGLGQGRYERSTEIRQPQCLNLEHFTGLRSVSGAGASHVRLVPLAPALVSPNVQQEGSSDTGVVSSVPVQWAAVGVNIANVLSSLQAQGLGIMPLNTSAPAP